jgi:hypothetical protein
VRACGADSAEWERRWHTTAEETVTEKAANDDTEAPYLGLNAYQTYDSGRFFGRDRLVGELLELVRGRRFSGVFGLSQSYD